MKGLNLTMQSGPSKILDRYWKEKDAAMHRRKISQVKSTIR